MDLGLAGKRAVVTGGSKGIGRAIALALAEEGAQVAICGRSEGALREAEGELRKAGGNVYAAVCDVGEAQALEAFLEACRKQLGGVDLLVNNVTGSHFDDSPEDWEASLRVDILGAVRACNQVIPWMEAAGGGSILFISSISGLEGGSPGAYTTVKLGLVGYAKSLAVKLGPKQIRCNVLAPGSIEFEGGSWRRAREERREFYERVVRSVPMGRLGRPEEVAWVAGFLLSERANWVTGATVVVDGGQHKGVF